MFDNKTRTELTQFGEFKLIEHLTQNINHLHTSTIKGIGDDAAIIKKNDIHSTVITTDMLVEGIHFDLAYVPLKHLGYKAVSVNVSDICAMNATPKQITLSVSVSNRFSVEALEEFYEGIYAACNKYKIDLIGGDTTSSIHGFIISITAIGEVENNKITYRNGAKTNDLICISGDLGAAYMGLQILEREKRVFNENPNLQPDLSGNDYIIERQLKPEARIDIIDLFSKIQVLPSSMIDISDGLASELLHICTQSKVGCEIYEEKIPIDPQTYDRAREFNLVPTTCALNGGEDYELLFTVSLSDYDKIKNDVDITIIGHITKDENDFKMISNNNVSTNITAQGWNAFNQNA